MTQPRMVFALTTYHVTRTTLDRKFLLRPSPVVNGIMRYCLFRAAQKYGVLVHSVVVQSNHFHAVVTDVRGEISAFMHWFDMMVAKNLIAHYARSHPDAYLDAIWDKTHFNAVILPNAAAVIAAIGYDLSNPVKDGLVRDHREWPGLISRPADWARSGRRVKRPKGLYFSERDASTRYVTERFTVPPALQDRSLGQAVNDVCARVRDCIRAARANLALEQRACLGTKAVLAADPFDSPQQPRVKGKSVPTFASGGDQTLLREGTTLVRRFRQTYRDKWRELTRRVSNVMFPAGTYLLKKRLLVRCEDWQPPWCIAV